MEEVFKTIGSVHPVNSITDVVANRHQQRAQGIPSPVGGKILPHGKQAHAPKTAKEATDAINTYLRSVDHGLRFVVDRESDTTVIQVIDKSTNKVMRQIPPELAVRLAARLQRLGRLDTTALTSQA